MTEDCLYLRSLWLEALWNYLDEYSREHGLDPLESSPEEYDKHPKYLAWNDRWLDFSVTRVEEICHG